jgi:DnaJ domain
VPAAPDPNADPYRALGLEPGASMAEVKRAYRLLAKAFHPDSAGEAALPRFLAIHAAYEQLKTGRAATGPRAARAPTPPPAEPWRADPARARAARERARTARPGSAKAGAASGGGGAGGGTSRGRGAAGPGAAPGAGPTGGTTSTGATGSSARGGRGSTGTRGPGRSRSERKATMGSTSYDEARDPSDATWSGASWYGPSSGEYWIVNPREYADPRKHGPEYQQRARRLAEDDVPEAIAGTEAPAAAAPSADAAFADAPFTEEPESARASAATGGAATRARQPIGRAAGAPRAGNPMGATPRWANLGETAPPGIPTPADDPAFRGWLGGASDDPVRRLGLALVAWPPIGLAAAAVIGDVTGCTAFAASCTGSEPLLPWLAQAAILGLLLLLPPVTRILAGGAVGVLLALVPITAFLVAVGGTGAPQAGTTLAVLLGIAWLLGVGWSTVSFRQRRSVRAGP